MHTDTPAATYQIKVGHFEGPYDLLLFFIERDELDITDIPISKIITDFLAYIHAAEKYNIALASEFILFVAMLMRIKAKMILPRPELDAAGEPIDPRMEMAQQLLIYKQYKEIARELSDLEMQRRLLFSRGNRAEEVNEISREHPEMLDARTLSAYRLSRAFERVLKRMQARENNHRHVVFQHTYTMEASREYVSELVRNGETLAFEKVFQNCETKLHAIYIFLSILEMVQQGLLRVLTGGGRNNFMLSAVHGEEDGEMS